MPAVVPATPLPMRVGVNLGENTRVRTRNIKKEMGQKTATYPTDGKREKKKEDKSN
jgi:hypothetical protein